VQLSSCLGFLAARIRTIAWIPIESFEKFFFSKKKKKHVELKLGHPYKSLKKQKKKKTMAMKNFGFSQHLVPILIARMHNQTHVRPSLL